MARFTGFARIRVQAREPFSYRARDGLPITGFLTRPSTPPPWPAVLVVHGGPWWRDRAQFDPWAQFLAGAGMCCVQVNYRGSRGFGKQFRDAGDRQWSLAMQDDLVDALQTAEVADVIDRDRIAAIGHGYGGYAALMLATQAEVPLACATAGSAPTDLPSYVASLKALGGTAGAEQAARIGDPVEDRDQLIATSPVSRAADISVPLLLFHGRQDARVPVHHAEALAAALEQAGQRYKLTIYSDEGHRYARPQNVVDCRAQCLEFLLTNLQVGADRRCAHAGVIGSAPECLDGLVRSAAADQRLGQVPPRMRGVELRSHRGQSLRGARGLRGTLVRLAGHDEREAADDLSLLAFGGAGVLAACDRLLGELDGVAEVAAEHR